MGVQIGELERFLGEKEMAFVYVRGLGSVFVHLNTFRKVEQCGEDFEFQRYQDEAAKNKELLRLRPRMNIAVLDVKPTPQGLRAKKWGLAPS